jgi:type I restriction enzyme, S subunit
MSSDKVKLKEVLKQYRNTHWVQNDRKYGQVTISQTGEVSLRGELEGSKIGRKRQFLIDLKKHPDTLIFIRQGIYKGGIGIAPKEVDGCIATENMPMFDIVGVSPEYLVYYTRSPQFRDDVNKLVPLGTAQKALHERQLLEVEMPLPSTKEQKRITDKIKGVNQYLAAFNQGLDGQEDNIVKLRQSILREAVSGRLVPQDPKDEPTSTLLKKIKAEKDRLVREGRIRKEKELPPVSEEEKPYELPKGWEWVRLGDITSKIGSGSTPRGGKSVYQTQGIKFIRSQNVWDNGLWLDDIVCISDSTHERMSNTAVLPNDLLLNITGASIGRSCIVPKDFNEAT